MAGWADTPKCVYLAYILFLLAMAPSSLGSSESRLARKVLVVQDLLLATISWVGSAAR